MDPPSIDPPPDPDYPGFIDKHKNRRTVIWVGGNDGMMHAIDARTGIEVYAFIPFNLLPKLKLLPDGNPVGPEGSAVKLTFATLMQRVSGLELELRGEESLRHEDWDAGRGRDVHFVDRIAGYRYLRSKGNSIEGGTSEILRNIIAERVLGLPREPRVDKDVPWKDLPR